MASCTRGDGVEAEVIAAADTVEAVTVVTTAEVTTTTAEVEAVTTGITTTETGVAITTGAAEMGDAAVVDGRTPTGETTGIKATTATRIMRYVSWEFSSANHSAW